jgi:hypothetical protein
MSKKPDYLTLCSIAAQKAGTSYGKYMAMHGYHPPIQADTEGVEAPQGISKICPQCGKKFTHWGQDQAENLLQLGVSESPRPESRSKEIPR